MILSSHIQIIVLTSNSEIHIHVFRVPEEKQTMFLPEVIEEEAEDIKPSQHASTMSLAAHPNDSPSCERR